MTCEQWTLISNIVHSYDKQNILRRIYSHLKSQLTKPMKLRCKSFSAIQFIHDTARSLALLIKVSPQFQSLPFDLRRKLMKNNLYLTNCLNRLLIHREIDLFTNETFVMSFQSFYGSILFEKCLSFLKKTELNGIFFKVIVFVLIFSSNSSIVIDHFPIETNIDLNLKSILEFQDLYITLLWKYLIYQYGYTEAILRYASLIKTILDMHFVMETMIQNDWYCEMIKQINIEVEEILISDE